MSTWSERMTSVVTACGPRAHHPGIPYHRRLEKVKFGVPLDQVCKKDIPGPLLVMLLKLNKEGPFKKDVFRAPGHQGNMRKLIHFLQQGRLVNIHTFSVNTIASVLKKFLRKIPGGIFGPEIEKELFSIVKMEDTEAKLELVQRLFLTLPIYSQHLLVLLFGTFRVIHSNCVKAKTGMTAEALGVSVAPSFFHTCVSTGKTAKMEDVERFKLATKVTTFFIEHFGIRNLFGRENYEYYARLTGRILKVEDEWIFFTYPPVLLGSRDDMDPSLNRVPSDDAVGGPLEKTGSLEIIPESCALDPQGRLSISLDDQNVSSPSSCGSPGNPKAITSAGGQKVKAAVSSSSTTPTAATSQGTTSTAGLGAGKQVAGAVSSGGGRGRGGTAASTLGRSEFKSYTCLPQWDLERRHSAACFLVTRPVSSSSSSSSSSTSAAARIKAKGCCPITHLEPVSVHQRQTERMKHRSEWFLSDPTGLVTVKCRPVSVGSGVVVTAHTPRSSPLQPVRMQQQQQQLLHHPLPSRPSSLGPQHSTKVTKLLLFHQQQQKEVGSSSSSPIVTTLSTPSFIKGSSLSHLSDDLLPPVVPSPPPLPPQQQQQSTVSLRRRLSDKDKERRLVRRSSSKRKDKENGGGGSLCKDQCGKGSASSLTSGAPGTPTGSRPTLKRAGSADGCGPAANRHHHSHLCRTGSQDTPHPSAAAAVGSVIPAIAAAAATATSTCGSATATPPPSHATSTESLTRSLPRI